MVNNGKKFGLKNKKIVKRTAIVTVKAPGEKFLRSGIGKTVRARNLERKKLYANSRGYVGDVNVPMQR